MASRVALVDAVCSLMLGDPQRALDNAEIYRRSAPSMGTDNEVKAVAYVGLGDLEAAREAARAHARDAVTGRVVSQATDGLLVLAVLAEAEGDRQSARDLMLNMGICRSSELISYSQYFARQLGVGAEFDASQASLLADSGGLVRKQAAADIVTLRQAMARND